MKLESGHQHIYRYSSIGLFVLLTYWTTFSAKAHSLDGDPSRWQTGTISGTVTDAITSQPLPGAQVIVVGFTIGTITDLNGKFLIENVPDGVYSVQARFVGYQDHLINSVEVKNKQTTTIHFTLIEGVDLGEVLVEYDRPLMQKEGMIPAYISNPSKQVLVNTDEYAFISESGFLRVHLNPLSTFSIDVDRASYALVRSMINQEKQPPIDAVRIEELINYFDYEYQRSVGDEISLTTELGRAPWNSDHLLLHVGLKANEIPASETPASNLVFLIDTSGSMRNENKLGLLKRSFALLVEQLGAEDRISIVAYAGSAGLILPPTRGDQKKVILEALNQLQAGGSTAGGAGIELAYKTASSSFLAEGNNRVILATDGDFNVGTSNTGDLVRYIQDHNKKGIALSVLGLGHGNLKDYRMEQLANDGDGEYYYIDSILEGKKVFVDELQSTLFTVAKDVKIQIEFNPSVVASYRLIGYENRALADEDFKNDAKDAGEMGSGHDVTALYEIVLAPDGEQSGSGLRYQQNTISDFPDELGMLSVRYKRPNESSSVERSRVISSKTQAKPSLSFNFAASVAMFGMILRESKYAGTSTLDQVVDLARSNKGLDQSGYRSEFIQLVEKYQLMPQAHASN